MSLERLTLNSRKTTPDGLATAVGGSRGSRGATRGRRNPVGNWWGSTLGSAFAFVATLARVAVLGLLASLVVLFGRGSMERAGEVTAASPLKALAVGFSGVASRVGSGGRSRVPTRWRS